MKRLQTSLLLATFLLSLFQGEAICQVDPFTSSGTNGKFDETTRRNSLFTYGDVLDRLDQTEGTSPKFNEALRNIAKLLCDQNQFDQAERILNRALKLSKTYPGGQVTDEVECLSALADLYKEKKELNRAKSFALDCVALSRTQWDTTYRFSPVAFAGKLQQLAVIETELREFKDAQKNLKEAYSAIQNAHANNLEPLGKLKRHMAWCYGEEGKIDEAIKNYEESFTLIDQAEGPKHGYNLADDFMFEYANLLESAGRPDAAQSIRARIEKREQTYKNKEK